MPRQEKNTLSTLTLILVLAFSVLTACNGVDGNVGYQPPLVPVKISLDTNGELRVSWEGSYQTPIGTFSAGVASNPAQLFPNINGTLTVRVDYEDAIYDLGGQDIEINLESGYYKQVALRRNGKDWYFEVEKIVVDLPTQDINPPVSIIIPTFTLAPTIIPTIIPIPNTPNDTILEIGQTWYQNGKSLTLNNVSLGSFAVANSENIKAEWIFGNTSTHDMSINFTEDNFNANNNLGEGVTYKRFYDLPNGNGSTVVFASGESMKFSIDLWIGNSAPSINMIIITVSLSDIQNARWNVPIYH